ncbi:succinylglutamate desuccinylase/aspartoacylase family protein [Mesorhizobium sp. BAC0120]|uniref:succinylglutamate desuccinylase/aspartoacylase family protein n=1 Tax=Mesorhizobium sp. BAC0120 TaxID=3090670 RepID=UPI00298C9BBD|nr:succinylglutamate desuccinylase/aspartoacylase family protein [Mesorhizobium sp. BAC0120]MDW6022930.1 succinylglutamate desuccinylase/aspartoacylase family protein [Mesorhizobium sp. BAC0120]
MERNTTQQLTPATVDFDKPGKQIGAFHVPFSAHDDAWGVVPVPVAVISNGKGPTVILEGGNHGDEYEGPITLGELIRDLDPASVSGRLIFIPAINQPAVMAAQRVSPIDGINMNRTFPGDPLGTTTRQIAAFVNDVLFPMGDVFIDLHSGGSSLDIIPSAVIEPGKSPEQHEANVAAATAFGAPIAVVIDNRGDPRTATASAALAGLTVIGTEMAGGGTVSIDALALCRRGVRNVLAHLGVVPRHFATPVEKPPALFELTSRAHVIVEDDGVFEPIHRLGTEVRAGELAGRIHFITQPGRKPVDLHYRADGIVYGRRQPGRVRPGNCCLVVATPYESKKP